MKKEVINILIADDHDIIRQGLRRIIGFEEDFFIVGEAENGNIALEMLSKFKPDVVLLDINMPLINGVEALKKIKESQPSTKVIMLTIKDDRNTIHLAINSGADGYVLKESAGTEIVRAIRTVYNGEKYIDKSLVSLLFADIKSKEKRTSSIFDILSKREVEVLIAISKGFSNKEIGKSLFLSEKTVKNYATTVFRKINVDDRVQATILAIENNIQQFYKDHFEGKE